MSADLVHKGHLNIIKIGKEYGKVVIGLLTDEAIATYKRVPLISYKDRKVIVENLKGVDKVIAQETLDYTENLKKIKPDYVVHGDDWKTGVQKSIRNQVLKQLNTWGGKLIEPEYTPGVTSTDLISAIKLRGVLPYQRMINLQRLIKYKPLVRVLEAHNGITGLIVENTFVEKNDKREEFDCIWESSLTDSTSKGKPDTELIDFTSGQVPTHLIGTDALRM